MNKKVDPQKFGAIGKEDAASLLASLSPSDRELFERLMNDKTARDKFLSSPEALKIISQLMGGR